MPLIAYREAVSAAMREEMERDDRVFLLGEEVALYNGAFKASAGLYERFGERRVIDAPISEAGFAGLGIGAAMAGLRPIIEFMTFNFAVLALDQVINNAAKIHQMSGGQLRCPIVFRGPTGSAQQLASQHSQSLEAQYAHIPGLKVVMPATPRDAKGLLKAAIRDDDPVIVMENETLYGLKGEVEDGELVIPIGQADVKRAGADVTIVTWGKMIFPCLDAATLLAKDGIDAEVIDLRTVRPIDEKAILDSVAKTHRAVVVEEAWPLAGVGGSVTSLISTEGFDDLDAPVQRLNGIDAPMSYAKNLESLALPTAARIAAAARRACYRES